MPTFYLKNLLQRHLFWSHWGRKAATGLLFPSCGFSAAALRDKSENSSSGGNKGGASC